MAGKSNTLVVEGAHYVFVVCVAAVLALPCLLAGLPAGYDSEYHVAYLYHFSQQFWNGDSYPHWLTGANKGYGSPIFLINYPLPYFVTSLLRPVLDFPADDLREARELGVLFFLALAGAGLAARTWLRKSCSPVAATIGALLYISLPHVLGDIVYLRTALGALCALVWMPLALAVCEQRQLNVKAIVALAFVWALLLLTHLTTAIIFLPLLLAYAAASGKPTPSDSIRRLVAAGSGVALGIGLAGFYFVPFTVYRHLFDLDAMRAIIPEFEVGRWFAHVPSISLERRMVVPALVGAAGFSFVAAFQVLRARVHRFSRIGMMLVLMLGVVALVPDIGALLIRASGLTVTSFETAGDFPVRKLITTLMTVALAFMAYCYLDDAVSYRAKLLLAVVCFSFLVMLPWSAPLWQIGALTNIQFPYRFGSALTIAVVGLFAMAVNEMMRQRSRLNDRSLWLLGSAGLAVVAVGAFAWRVQMRFSSPATIEHGLYHNVDNMFRSYVSADQVPSFARRISASAETFEVDLTPVDEYTRGEAIRVEIASGSCSASVTPTEPGLMEISAECDETAVLRVGQLYSPLWRIQPGDGPSDPQVVGSSNDGLIELVLSPGSHNFSVAFNPGSPLRTGIIVTLLSALVAVIAVVLSFLRLRARRKLDVIAH